ncbi:two-component response regulator ARR12 isoform X2 [Ricinus communis]|uniref:two-component response regulator ARR12 isoform X2 n=1 Tax=Ricinus communis TaxID=3988 RepID=UPI00201AA3CB|nr:two-component response regulator ARR12 isoform X2 [Ricinus communis]
MTVEDKRSSSEDKFPVGMRVLAVDDDPICLKVLDTLLKKCQYQVTTTNQAIQALKMLRENRNKYDLVISDVNMPDMDGFKLLELVGLEMDLPVIMLSAHSDKELVYKGVTHGAVDYLLKPVRIEELKNIWQHVIRRKKLQPKDQSRSQNQDKPLDGAGEGGQGMSSSGSEDQNGKVNRKRKDQDEDEEEEGEDNLNDTDEPGAQKKPRVVWSVELHRKFVAAVNQLGLDKAVPKKILDLMNVEGLTRENVASHLQKYRLYLKRISTTASQQANMVAAFGIKDSSYLRMASLDGFGEFRTLSGPGRLSSTSISSYHPSGMLGRLNSPSGLTLRGIASSGLLQPGQSQSLSSSVNTLGKLQPTLLHSSQGVNLFQGIPSSLEPNQLQSKSSAHFGEFNRNDDSSGFSLTNSFSDARVTIGSLSNTATGPSSNPMMLQAHPQQNQNTGVFATQSSLSVPSLNQESFDVGVRGSSNFLDHSRCNESWQGAVQLSKFSTTLPLSEPFSHDALSTSNFRDNMSSTNSRMVNSPTDYSSSAVLASPLDTRVDMQGQTGFAGNVVQSTSYNSRQRWEEHGQDYNPNLSNSFSTINPLVSGNGVLGSLSHCIDRSKKFDAPLVGQSPSSFQQAEVETSPLEPKMRSNEDYLLEQTKSQNGYESLDDIMNAMIKREQNEAMLMDGEFSFDPYSLGSCL